MKFNFTLLSLFLMFSFIGCKKDKPSPLPLMGKWELRQQHIEDTLIVYPPGNSNTLKFSDHNRYERYDSTAWLDGYESSTFSLSRETDKSTGDRIDLIRFGNSGTRDIYTVKGDTLWLSFYPYDDDGEMIMSTSASTYVRIR